MDGVWYIVRDKLGREETLREIHSAQFNATTQSGVERVFVEKKGATVIKHRVHLFPENQIAFQNEMCPLWRGKRDKESSNRDY